MTKPSDLSPYVFGQDYRLHGQKPGESVGISIDELVPAGTIVNSKRDLEATGLYYKNDARLVSNVDDPILASLYALTDPMGVQMPKILNTYENKAVNTDRGFKTMAVEPATNDVYYVDTLYRLCKLNAVSNYETAELVETGISGIAFTDTRTYKCLSSNGDCIVINQDGTERTIPLSTEPAFPGAYKFNDEYNSDYLAVGDKIYEVDDNNVYDVAQTSNVMTFFVKAGVGFYYVQKTEEYAVLPVSEIPNFFPLLEFNENISNLYGIDNTLVGFSPSAAQNPPQIGTYDFEKGGPDYHSFYIQGLENLAPLTTSAYILAFNPDSGRPYNLLYTKSREIEDEFDVQVNPTMYNAAAQTISVDDLFFVNGGEDASGNGYIFSSVLQPADPDLMQLPGNSFVPDTAPYIRRG